ncbi:MAG: RHS repeat-associated core domain-containing protein [Myxococcota bacterium]
MTTGAGVVTYGYLKDGLLEKATYRDTGGTVGHEETRGYDEAGRLTTLETRGSDGTLLVGFDYAYDGNGNRQTQVERRGMGSPETTRYGYDFANRLVGVEYPDETQLYQLDAVGNRTGEKRAAPGVVSALTVAAFAALLPANATAYEVRQHNAVDWLVRKQVVVPAGGPTTTLEYDGNGNRVTEGTKRYAWDVRDTLTRVEDGAEVLGVYDYDAALQRVKADTAAGHVEYVLDGKYVLRESGARTRRYHYGEGKGLAVEDGGGARWLANDGLGSVSAEVSRGGAVGAARKYDAWGNYRGGTAPASSDVRLGYTGHQYDVETGLTYARARYYDSVNGVFLSRDSYPGQLDNAPSLHRYAYAHSNPLRYTDPSGRFIPIIIGLAILGAELGFFGNVIYQEVNEGKNLDTVDYSRAGNAALVGAAAGAAVGAAVVAAPAVASTVMTGMQAGATGVGLGLAGETALDLGSVALNGWQCAQGDQASCAGTVTAALDAVQGPNVVGDLAAARALFRGKGSSGSSSVDAPPGLPVSASGAPKPKLVVESTDSAAYVPLQTPSVENGVAVVRYYKNPDETPHFSVEVQPPGGTSLETHQVASRSLKKTYVNEVTPDTDLPHPAGTKVIELPNPDAAKAKQLEQMAQGDMGPWKGAGPKANSCATHVCDVLSAGGADSSEPSGAGQWLRDLFEIKNK